MSGKQSNKKFLGFLDPNWTDEEIADWIVEAVQRSRAEAEAARASRGGAPDDEASGDRPDPPRRQPETATGRAQGSP